MATAVSSDLDEALTQYQSGNTAGAAATFQKAYSISYSASNMGNVVESTIGQETATAQQQAFTDLRTQAYATGNDAAIAAAVASLKTSLTDSATTLDATGSLASPRDYAAAQAATIATERAEIEANRKDVNEGRQGRTWTEVAGEMTPLIDQAVDKATGGDGRAGADLVNNAYYGYYEKLGFEKTVMAAISGNRVSQVENQFKVVRQAMINGADDSEVTADAESLKSMLTEDAAILDGGAAASVNPTQGLPHRLLRPGVHHPAARGPRGDPRGGGHHRLPDQGGNEGSRQVHLRGHSSGPGRVRRRRPPLRRPVRLRGLPPGGPGGRRRARRHGMLLYMSNWMLSKSSTSSWNAYIKAGPRRRSPPGASGPWRPSHSSRSSARARRPSCSTRPCSP